MTARRKFLVWMYSPDYPIWSMPEASARRIADALPADWELRTLEEEGYFAGDGARGIPGPLLSEIRDAEVYCGFGIPREAFLEARELRWVHSGAAGVGGSLFEEMRASDVRFTNSAGLHAEPLGEHAIGLMLHFSRGLDIAAARQRERTWSHEELAGTESPLRELSGLTAGVVGYGGIGSAVGRRARALGMRVVGTRRHPDRVPPEVSGMYGPEGLDDLLAESDVVVLCLPETASTEALIGGRELALMKPDAVLINVSRGGIVEEEALVSALRSGELRGAGLDVFAREPLPPESPLWDFENVVVTPHSGAVSPRFWDRETELIVENLRRYLEGEPLVNLVNKERGY